MRKMICLIAIVLILPMLGGCVANNTLGAPVCQELPKAAPGKVLSATGKQSEQMAYNGYFQVGNKRYHSFTPRSERLFGNDLSMTLVVEEDLQTGNASIVSGAHAASPGTGKILGAAAVSAGGEILAARAYRPTRVNVDSNVGNVSNRTSSKSESKSNSNAEAKPDFTITGP